MNNGQGIFIVVEGVDGSGKGTQFRLLTDRLKAEGYEVEAFNFPQYDRPSSYFVTQYLNGAYGSAEEVGPYTASLFYALDRYEAAPKIREALAKGKIVLANRFTGSNMAHQGTKFDKSEERRGYFIWNDNLEFMMLRIPRPTISFVMRMPAELAQAHIAQKLPRDYTDKTYDLHESDLNHLRKAAEVYDDLTQLFPKDFVRVDAMRGDTILPIDVIQDIIWQKVHPLLPEPQHINDARVSEQGLAPDDEQELRFGATELPSPHPESVGQQAAQKEVAATHTPRGLDEAFSDAQQKDRELVEHLKTDGGEPAQPFAGLHVVAEHASNLTAEKLYQARQLAYLELPEGYAPYEQKDQSGNYRYFTPELDEQLAAQYKQHMDHIFDLYAFVAGKLMKFITDTSTVPDKERGDAWVANVRARAYDAATAMLPAAAAATVGVYGSAESLEILVARLLGDELPEVRATGNALLEQARRAVPAFLAPSKATTPPANRQPIAALANSHLPDHHAAQDLDGIRLTNVWPRNELDLVADMLYEHSNMSLVDIQLALATWPFARKLEVFEAYTKRSGHVLEKAHYSWDILDDYGTYRDIRRIVATEDAARQQLTPRHGYEIPKIVEDAELTDQFEEAFATSLKLHSLLQAAGRPLEAQYATLLGHKMRWMATYNAAETMRLHSASNPGSQALVARMQEVLSQAHPMLGETIHTPAS